ncbi:hypothetical protein BKA69DRAFT_1129736 [Paraphysoderma sedebokerense]|nr:hypothetical protein BKA69DRAFT_1129736 [Paraphysoderma sedebokerense]
MKNQSSTERQDMISLNHGVQNEILAVLRQIKEIMSKPAPTKQVQLESSKSKHAEAIIMFLLGALIPIIISILW